MRNTRYHHGTAAILGAAGVPSDRGAGGMVSGVGGLFTFGGTVSTDAFLTKGYQIDLEMGNVDTLITRLERDAGALDPSAGATWRAQKAEWDRYYQANVASPPILPFISQSESDAIEMWLTRVAGWKERAASWAAKSQQPALLTIAKAIPLSPAAAARQATIEAAAKDAQKPTSPWLKAGIGAACLLGAGWLASSVARFAR